MKVFLPTCADEFEFVHPRRERDFSIFNDINGSPVASTWIPVPVDIIHETPEDGKLGQADVPRLTSNILAFRRGAAQRLGSLLSDNGELLELECAETELMVFNCTVLVDALDELRSDFDRLPGGPVFHIRKYAFQFEECVSAISSG